MAALVDLTKQWPLTLDEPGDLHPLFGETTGQPLPRLLFFPAGYSIFVVMSTCPPDHMLPSRCIDMSSRNSFKERTWTLSRS